MRLGGSLWSIKDLGKSLLVESDLVGLVAYYVGGNFLPVFLSRTENGYLKQVENVDIVMSHPVHFSEFLTEKPLQGYIQQADIMPGDTVVDAGAYPGEFTIYAAKKGAQVIALEPDPKNAEELRENVEMNGIEEKVTIVEKGLWSHRGTKKMERDPRFGLGSEIGENGKRTIELVSLDDLVDQEIDLVKMDIEGAEIQALKGAERVMQEIEPEFAIATYHDRAEGHKTFHEVEDILEEHGYESETGYPRHLTTYGSKE